MLGFILLNIPGSDFRGSRPPVLGGGSDQMLDVDDPGPTAGLGKRHLFGGHPAGLPLPKLPLVGCQPLSHLRGIGLVVETGRGQGVGRRDQMGSGMAVQVMELHPVGRDDTPQIGMTVVADSLSGPPYRQIVSQQHRQIDDSLVPGRLDQLPGQGLAHNGKGSGFGADATGMLEADGTVKGPGCR